MPADHEINPFELTEIVNRIRRALRASIRSEYPWESLPMAQVEILQRLAEQPGLGVSDLARRHRLATNTVSNLIQQMVTSGLVERTTNPADRRAVTLRLTAAGSERLHGWQLAHEHRIETALAALSPADRKVIARALPALTRLAAELEPATEVSG